MHPMFKAALRALLVLGVIGVGTMIVVDRGGTGPAGSIGKATGGTSGTTHAPTSSTTSAPPTADMPPVASDPLPDTGGYTSPAVVADAPPPTAAAEPEAVGPPPTIPESGTPWLLPVTGAVTVAAVGGVVVWRARRRRA